MKPPVTYMGEPTIPPEAVSHPSIESPHSPISPGSPSMQFFRSLSLGSNDPTPPMPLSLHDACRAGDAARVRELLDQGADVHSRDANGRSPLQCAVAKATTKATTSDLDVLQVLASHGAQWDADTVGEASIRAALHVCYALWTDEHSRPWPLSDVPIEIVSRGVDSTRAYLDSLRESTREIVSRGVDSTRAYLDSLRESTRGPLCRRMVCVVGPSKSGKTTLVRALAEQQQQQQSPPAASEAFGVDIYKWTFERTPGQRRHQSARHELTLWDFAGGDDKDGDDHAARRLAALLSTHRSLRVVCVDALALLDAAATVAAPAEDSDSSTNGQPDPLDEFVDSSVLPWVRAVTTHEPTGTVVLVVTKMDLVRDQNEVAVKNAKARVAERLQGQLKATAPRGPLEIRWLTVSCERGDAAVIREIATEFETLVVEDDKSFAMPDTYTTVLDAILELRAENAKIRKSDRAAHQIIPTTKLIRLLCDKFYLQDSTVSIILQTFHDMGDILWFYDDPKPLRDVVILDPGVFVETARIVVLAAKRERNDEVMPHATLMGLDLWNSIDDVATAALKQLLVKARLAYASRGNVEWDSDLIVPAYWKTHSAWETPLTIPDASEKDASTKPLKLVRWQYHFVGALPRDFFEKVLVESYSPLWGRTIARNGIVFETEDEDDKDHGEDAGGESTAFACRLVVDESIPDQCVVHLTGASYAKDAPSWWIFQYAAQAIETVLDSYDSAEGVVWVSRCALNDDDEPHRLETVVAYWDETSPAYRSTISWLPPDVAWYSEIIAKRSKKAT